MFNKTKKIFLPIGIKQFLNSETLNFKGHSDKKTILTKRKNLKSPNKTSKMANAVEFIFDAFIFHPSFLFFFIKIYFRQFPKVNVREREQKMKFSLNQNFFYWQRIIDAFFVFVFWLLIFHSFKRKKEFR
jgi:hypothetical protein